MTLESQVVDGYCPKHGRTWVTDGACRLCKIHGESEMESQVVLDDKTKHAPSFVSFAELQAGTLFSAGDDSSVLLKLRGQYAVWIRSRDGLDGNGEVIGGSPASWQPRPLPHLRLRLVLENRT